MYSMTHCILTLISVINFVDVCKREILYIKMSYDVKLGARVAQWVRSHKAFQEYPSSGTHPYWFRQPVIAIIRVFILRLETSFAIHLHYNMSTTVIVPLSFFLLY
jgi:hypothetical protein